MLNTLTRSIIYFLLAGLMEIGGGYLMWLCLRERWAWWVGALGALLLVTYGIVPTFQPANFGRVYAAYGGVFVAMSMLWGWWIDGHRPDFWDVTGSCLCFAGVIIIMYIPRSQ
jgi:small multidrug resistance family-3 protein